MSSLISRYKKFLLPALLVLISVVISTSNYTLGSILSGWDTLHPEFDLVLYLERIFWGVWQQHQGLGAVAAQAHASELGRLWYLIVAAAFLPTDLFRYGYFWITLILGPLGTYFLLKKFVRPEAAYLGGLLYLLNLGTMQHFYLPLEMFATAYAFLPWLFWAVTLRKPLILAGVFLLAAPMAHTPTLFFVNFAALSLFSLIWDRRWGIKVLLIGLIVNSFWLLPTIYFLLNHGSNVVNSHISEQFSPLAIMVNKEFGTASDLALVRGYLFNWGHFDFSQRQFSDLMSVWKPHFNKSEVLIVGYGFFAMVLGGIIVGIKNHIKIALAFLPVFLLAVVAMLNFIPLPQGVLSEAFRFPFTKFSLLLMLCFAVYFGLMLESIFVYLRSKIFIPVICTTVTAVLIFYMWPAFEGNLICSCVRVKIPEQYQQTFNFFKDQDPNTRIAPFPVDSIYGWNYSQWGYEGAGFRWFGLRQPILDREFDRWMPTNENYYWEISYALYSKNLPLFENVLEKYRVNWLILDENVINPTTSKALFNDEFKELVKSSEKISFDSKFGNVEVYRVELDRSTQNFVSIATEIQNVSSGYQWGNLDQAFVDFGDYVETSGQGIDYSFRSLFSGKRQENLEYEAQNVPTGLEQVVHSGIKECTQTSMEQIGRTTECATFYLPELLHEKGYLVTVESKNIYGQPLSFWVENLNSRRADLATYLPKSDSLSDKTIISNFILPPMDLYGLGYSLHFDNISAGKEKSENQISKVTISPIQYRELMTAKSEKLTMDTVSYLGNNNFSVYHPNTSFYRVDLNNSVKSNSTLILSQSFEKGWVAIDQNIEFIEHKKVNNWANGWEMGDDSKTVYIFFWPQVLQFVGLTVLGILLIVLILSLVRNRGSHIDRRGELEDN